MCIRARAAFTQHLNKERSKTAQGRPRTSSGRCSSRRSPAPTVTVMLHTRTELLLHPSDAAAAAHAHQMQPRYAQIRAFPATIVVLQPCAAEAAPLRRCAAPLPACSHAQSGNESSSRASWQCRPAGSSFTAAGLPPAMRTPRDRTAANDEHRVGKVLSARIPESRRADYGSLGRRSISFIVPKRGLVLGAPTWCR